MKIEHLALYVSNLEAMKDFYIKYFNAKAGALYHNPRTGLKTYFLSFDGDCRLEIMTRPGLSPRGGDTSLGYIHFALSAGSKEEVDSLTQKLKNAGIEVLSGPRATGDGYYESQIKDPEGNIIEITE